MAETRVLLATPLKGGVSHHYCNRMTEILCSPPPGYVFGHAFLAGTVVTAARDQLAREMERGNWDKILFWDDDMDPSIAQFHRLLSHDKEFVCGGYCKRDIHATWHIHPEKDAEILPDGLWEMQKAAIGFAVIDKVVFSRIKARHPERAYFIHEGGQESMELFEYFPWEIVGPNTAREKLARLKSLLDDRLSHPFNATETLLEISNIVDADDYTTNSLRGEDYAFCYLARESGTKIWLDSKLIIQHVGNCSYPISHDNLVKMTAEPWRQAHWAELKEQRAAASSG